jgi:hypothetical protein
MINAVGAVRERKRPRRESGALVGAEGMDAAAAQRMR